MFWRTCVVKKKNGTAPTLFSVLRLQKGASGHPHLSSNGPDVEWNFLSTNLQAEAKRLEDSSLYLNLPATKLELEEKGYSSTGKSTHNLGNCTVSKDSFQISTLVCSTKLTQNGEQRHTHTSSQRSTYLNFSTTILRLYFYKPKHGRGKNPQRRSCNKHFFSPKNSFSHPPGF